MQKDINYWIARCATLEQEIEMLKEQSVIKWQTGKPKEMCTCLVSIVGGAVEAADWDGVEWDSWLEDSIIAWCKLSDIKPYKEKTR